MRRDVFVALYLVVMIAIIVSLDVLFLRDLFWWRLITNIVIAAAFVAAYLLYFRKIIK
jgi:hypothetical protein